MIETTLDAFLGGRVMVRQPRRGYRAGTDPVLLAAACPALAGHRVLELGCGVGVAALCVCARVPGAHVTGIEVQPDYAELARANASANAAAFDVVTADIADMPAEIRGTLFDHVILNPPYFPPATGTPAALATRERALREDLPLAAWIDAATRRLGQGGTITLIARTDRLLDVTAALDTRLGTVAILPLAARAQSSANRFILRAMKGGRAAPQLLPPFVMHDGDQHLEDGDDFSPRAKAALRGGAAISMGR